MTKVCINVGEVKRTNPIENPYVILSEGIRDIHLIWKEGNFVSAREAQNNAGRPDMLFIESNDMDASFGMWCPMDRNFSFANCNFSPGDGDPNNVENEDVTPYFNAWLGLLKAGHMSSQIFFDGRRNSSKYFWMHTEPDDVKSSITANGAGHLSTIIVKNYQSSEDRKGIFNLHDGGAGFSCRDMTLMSSVGSQGTGCLWSAVSGNNGAPSQGYMENVVMAYLGTQTQHKFTVRMDGAEGQDAYGIDTWMLNNCLVYNAKIANMYIKSIRNMHVIGGGIYSPNNEGYIDIQGEPHNKSESVIFDIGACAVDLRLSNCRDCGMKVGYMAGKIYNNYSVENFKGAGRLSWNHNHMNYWTNSRWDDFANNRSLVNVQ